MSYDIELDMAALDALAKDLVTVIDEFENASSNAKTVAEATGASDLKDRVLGFESSWDIRRGKMVEDVKVLQQTIQMISESFTEADTELAKALEEAASDPPPASDYGKNVRRVEKGA